MPKQSRTLNGCTTAIVVALTLAVSTAAVAAPFSDFEDGTLQGWTPIASPTSGAPFGGILEPIPTGGNPGGYMRATDTVPASGLLYVAGPAEYRGDLSVYTEVRWDEILFAGSDVDRSTSARLIGSDNTVYAYGAAVGTLDEWRTLSAPLDGSGWTLIAGTMSFEDVLSDAWLAFNMEVSVSSSLPAIESGIDNIMLVPEPTTFILLALAGLSQRSRHRVR